MEGGVIYQKETALVKIIIFLFQNMNLFDRSNELPTATGLPTKDETSETTVQNLYCLFSYI